MLAFRMIKYYWAFYSLFFLISVNLSQLRLINSVYFNQFGKYIQFIKYYINLINWFKVMQNIWHLFDSNALIDTIAYNKIIKWKHAPNWNAQCCCCCCFIFYCVIEILYILSLAPIWKCYESPPPLTSSSHIPSGHFVCDKNSWHSFTFQHKHCTNIDNFILYFIS